MTRRWHRWRRSVCSALGYVVVAIPGTTITASGLRKSERLVGMLVEKRGI